MEELLLVHFPILLSLFFQALRVLRQIYEKMIHSSQYQMTIINRPRSHMLNQLALSIVDVWQLLPCIFSKCYHSHCGDILNFLLNWWPYYFSIWPSKFIWIGFSILIQTKSPYIWTCTHFIFISRAFTSFCSFCSFCSVFGINNLTLEDIVMNSFFMKSCPSRIKCVKNLAV